MKPFLYLFLASILGGMVALGIQSQFASSGKIISDPFQNKSSFHVAGNNILLSPLAFDFVEASDKSTPAVVHIHAEESRKLAQQRLEQERQQRRWSPWQDFFGFDDFFGNDMFGRNFYRPREGSGSGVIISHDGYIVTNNHVVGFADHIKVTLPSGKEYKAEKIGSDPSTDLAVLKIEAQQLPILRYGDSDKLKVGEWVLAVGNPFSYLTSTVTAGIVSAKGRELDIIKGEKKIEEFIQTDAAVNPGNSGGALVNTKGELIGINTAIATPTGVFAGYSFAIPSNLVKKVVNEIIEGGGDIDRKINLGIAGYDVDEEIIQEFKLKTFSGFYIDEVEMGGAAQLAGILPGDVITAINGDPVDGYHVIKEKMKFNKVGDTIELNINRDGKSLKIKTKLRKGL
ncbi:MAG TPA: trypsin-like peptidase domain-containing protein [Saprospiraceae bacterium]|nr:trypsin-like peptidase domain-containing protein [Saprospiraceae bacterium]